MNSEQTPRMSEEAKRLREIAEELEEMARGYMEKAAQLHHEAAWHRVAADSMEHTSAEREKGQSDG